MKITGAREHAAHLRGISGEAMVRRVGAALFAAGNLIEVDAEISITAGSVSGKNHVPSQPGQAPNADTRTLDTNIETVQEAPLRVSVTSNAPYSQELEFGTSKMAARPFMRPAAAKNKAKVTALVRRAVSQAVRS